jgi:hypothetical protein
MPPHLWSSWTLAWATAVPKGADHPGWARCLAGCARARLAGRAFIGRYAATTPHGDAAHDLLTDRRGHGPTVHSHDHHLASAVHQRTGDGDHGQGRTRTPSGPCRTRAASFEDPGTAGVHLDRRHAPVVSIWFHWDGTDLVMGTLPGAPKLKALHTGDRVAITIDTNDPPHHVLSIRGTAEVTQTEGRRPRVRAGGRPLSREGTGRGLRWVVAACHQDGPHRRAS